MSELSPTALHGILTTAVMAYFDQMKKDVEVRIAILLKLKGTGLPESALVEIASQCAYRLTELLRETVIMSGELDNLVRKLV